MIRMARFVMRPNGDKPDGLVLGFNWGLKPGVIYEVQSPNIGSFAEQQDVSNLTIVEKGPSCFNEPFRWTSVTWTRDAGSIIREGLHCMRTEEEYLAFLEDSRARRTHL